MRKKDKAIKNPKTTARKPNKGETKTSSQKEVKSRSIPKKGTTTKTAFTSSGSRVIVKIVPARKKSIARLKRWMW